MNREKDSNAPAHMAVANGVMEITAQQSGYDIGRRYTRVAMRPRTPQGKKRVSRKTSRFRRSDAPGHEMGVRQAIEIEE